MSGPPSTSRTEERLEFWERHELSFFRALPYPLLVLCAVFDIVVRHGLGDATAVDFALAAVSGALMAGADTLDQRESWMQTQESISSGLATLMFAGLVGLSAVLVVREPLYGFYSWTGYVWAWRLLRGNARFAGVALVALVTSISQTGSGPYRDMSQIFALAAVFLVNFGVSSAFTWFGSVGNEQQQGRKERMSALSEAYARLEASLQENAGLQEQLLQQAREAGIAEERRRLAREIHDTLAQALAGIVTQLQAAQRAGVGSGSGSPPAAAEHIDSAIQLARTSLAEARRSVQALTPEPLAGTRLPDAVQNVARQWSDLHGIPVSFTATGSSRVMRPEIEVALLRTAQEALANVAKHARARRVGLTLSYMEDLITLDVRDDGIGFATVNGHSPRRPRDQEGGFGLIAMRQRIEGVAGTLAIESEPGAGTAISAAVPAQIVAGAQ